MVGFPDVTIGRTGFSLVLMLSALVGVARLGAAQTADRVAALRGRPAVQKALEIAQRSEAETIADQIRLCEVPAPPFAESARAAVYASAMREAGLTNVRIDAEGNVLGERPGRNGGPHLVLSAHLDTVFPADTAVRVTRRGAWLHGPGIGDDCRGLAVVLAVARALSQAGVQTDRMITFVGTVGEEGLGDLRGVKALVGTTLKGRVARFISVDGDGYGVTNVGVGSRRYRVTFRGAGGHSYDDFGRANPVHALGRAIAAVAQIQVPSTPRTTFSVGRIGGGTSINAIATEAWMEVDLRSADGAALSSLDASLQSAVRRALDEENERRRSGAPLTVDLDVVGSRPAGRTDTSSALVESATAVLRALGLPVRLDAGSTDANLPMSLAIPSITVGGGGVGRNAHTPEEAFDTTDSWKGTQWVLLLAAALADDSVLPAR